MDGKSRKRLTYGFVMINTLYTEGVRLDQIRGTIQVWQTTPDEGKLEVRWNNIGPSRNSGRRRY